MACQCKSYILFAMFRVVRRKSKAPMTIGWFVININPNFIIFALDLNVHERNSIFTVFYCKLNYELIEFKILS